jgi:hypothetical protein
MRTFGSWEFTCEKSVTLEAYNRTAKGGCDTCSCNGCRNFAAVRMSVYPPGFIALLESLGVDPYKDGEVHHNGRVAANRHDYGGWFHFVGSLSKTGDFPVVKLAEGFTTWLSHASAPHFESLDGRNLMQIEFQADNVPWVLDELEPN